MKTTRHAKIIEIIGKYDVETQEDLARRLKEEGFPVTQATISRDIRELKLTKVAVEGGKQKYALMSDTVSGYNEKYIHVLQAGFVSMDMAQNILVVKTVSGMAMAVAAAIDSLHWPEVAGCIAGDDTIMCAIRSVDEAIQVMGKIQRIVSSAGENG